MSIEAKPEVPFSIDEFWRTHILKAKESNESDQGYCKKEGLNPKTYHNYKKKFGFVRTTVRRRRMGGFVQVETVCEKSDSTKVRYASFDPKWLAELLIALHRQ